MTDTNSSQGAVQGPVRRMGETGSEVRVRGGARRGTARAAVRLGVLLVDPWGPSRLRRWLHVTGARYSAYSAGEPRRGIGRSGYEPNIAVSGLRLPEGGSLEPPAGSSGGMAAGQAG